MPLEDFLDQLATIAAEAPSGVLPSQDAAGAADRSDANWVAVVAGVPCLVRERSSSLNYNRNDARADVITARIYFDADPVPEGISSRHRITVTRSDDDSAIVGVYAVQGTIDPNSMGRIFQVDCERIRTP